MRGPRLSVKLWHGSAAADVVSELVVGQVDLLVAGLVIVGLGRRLLSSPHDDPRRRLGDDLLDARGGGGGRGAVEGLNGSLVSR